MVTAELAVAMLSLLAVTAVLLWAVEVAGTRLRCAEAARAAARVAARGESAESAREAARGVVPAATVEVSTGPAEVRVQVSLTLRPIAGLRVAAYEVRSTAVAALEAPGYSDAAP